MRSIGIRNLEFVNHAGFLGHKRFAVRIYEYLEMGKKLDKKQLEKKIKYHEKRVQFYRDKLNKVDYENRKIGFKWY
jgi:hypothetical protein